jgi:hypothetical protein
MLAEAGGCGKSGTQEKTLNKRTTEAIEMAPMVYLIDLTSPP